MIKFEVLKKKLKLYLPLVVFFPSRLTDEE